MASQRVLNFHGQFLIRQGCNINQLLLEATYLSAVYSVDRSHHEKWGLLFYWKTRP